MGQPRDRERDELNDEAYGQLQGDLSSPLEADAADDSELRRHAERFARDTGALPEELDPQYPDPRLDVRPPSAEDIAESEARLASESLTSEASYDERPAAIRDRQPESQGEPLDDFTAEHPPDDNEQQDSGDRKYAH